MTLAYLLVAADPDDPFVTRTDRITSEARVGPAARAVDPTTRDTAWVTRIREGDRTAFTALYQEYLPAMLGFAFRMVRSSEIAEDLCAEIFVRLWERRETWAPRYGVRAYLFHAVRTRALNVLRDQTIATRVQQRMVEIERSSTSYTPIDDHLDDERKLAAVRAAIAAMPEARRRVMELRWQHGLSIDEVGAVMQLSRAAVDQHLSRGLRALRQLLPRMFEG